MAAMLAPIYPLPHPERVYLGVDIGKKAHYAALISASLLEHHKRFEKCPTHRFENTKEGFEGLLTFLCSHALSACCTVVLERTGHYHRVLAQYLRAQGMTVYEVTVQQRFSAIKSDKRDAQNLALLLYNQLERGVQVTDPLQIARSKVLTPTARALSPLVQHHHELTHETTQRKNKLTALCDELFPEFTQVFKDPNGPTALTIRLRFLTPAELAAAPFADLKACCPPRGRPGVAGLARLQELAHSSIGIKDKERLDGLCLEQAQLIKELRLLEQHKEELEARIIERASVSREGQILLSLPMISQIDTGILLAAIGSITNFESASKLKGFLGWKPDQDQTGITRDKNKLTRRGSRPLKAMMYMIGWRAIRLDPKSRALYDRLVPLKCEWDVKKEVYIGKNKVLGRIIGRTIDIIYLLLKKDYDLLATLQPGEMPPSPTLYDRDIEIPHAPTATPTVAI
jgi:transposase